MGSSGDTFSELFLSCRTLLTLEEALVEVDKVERLDLSSPMSFFAALSIGPLCQRLFSNRVRYRIASRRNRFTDGRNGFVDWRNRVDG